MTSRLLRQTTLLATFALSLGLLMPATARSEAWSTAGAIYSNDVLAVGKHTKNTRAVDFDPAGTMIYVLGRTTGNVAAFKLARPWTLDGGEFIAAFDLTGEVGKRKQQQVPHGLFMRKSDGAKMYVWNRTEIFEYDLTQPWDVTTAKLARYKEISNPVIRAHDIDISPDGCNLYIDDRGTAKVFQYKLGEPWNVESATYFAELDISKQQRAVRGTQFDPSGKRLFILDTIKRTIFEFDLATAWDLRSATPGATFALNDRFNNPRGLTWRPDGKAFFVTETKSETIHAYHLPDDGSLARHNQPKGE